MQVRRFTVSGGTIRDTFQRDSTPEDKVVELERFHSHDYPGGHALWIMAPHQIGRHGKIVEPGSAGNQFCFCEPGGRIIRFDLVLRGNRTPAEEEAAFVAVLGLVLCCKAGFDPCVISSVEVTAEDLATVSEILNAGTVHATAFVPDYLQSVAYGVRKMAGDLAGPIATMLLHDRWTVKMETWVRAKELQRPEFWESSTA